MKIVITGGAGFIGANLARRLTAETDAEVVAFDNLATGFRKNLDGIDAELVVGDILDTDALAGVVAGADAVVHLAARASVPRSVKDPAASHNANATGTLNVLEAARHANGAHVVVASSSSVYGSNPVLPKHEDLATRPMSPYAASKLATEAYTLAYGSSYGMDTLAFRFFNVYGPLQAAGHAYAAVIPAFVDAALRGQALPLQGDGSQTRDFTFVDTVTAVIADAIARRVASAEPVNLAYGTRTSLRELIDRIELELGHHVAVEHLPTRVGDVPHSQASNARLLALYPDIEPVPLDDGLRRTIEWMESHLGS